jgi:hypothetical protein
VSLLARAIAQRHRSFDANVVRVVARQLTAREREGEARYLLDDVGELVNLHRLVVKEGRVLGHCVTTCTSARVRS